MVVQLNWREQALLALVKQGPWAIVATALLCFFGYELHQFQVGAGAAVTDYVQQSTMNIRVIRDVTEMQTKTLHETQTLVGSNAQMLLHLTSLMSEAKSMMEPVAEAREKQTVILTEIRDSLK